MSHGVMWLADEATTREELLYNDVHHFTPRRPPAADRSTDACPRAGWARGIREGGQLVVDGTCLLIKTADDKRLSKTPHTLVVHD